MPDVTLMCRDCNTSFTFTQGEQEFYQEKGFNPPARCPECRQRRKAEKMATGGYRNGNGNGGFGMRGW